MALKLDSSLNVLSHNSLVSLNILSEIGKQPRDKKERLLEFHREAMKIVVSYRELIFYLNANKNRIDQIFSSALESGKVDTIILETIFPLPNVLNSTVEEVLIVILNPLTYDVRLSVSTINTIANVLRSNPERIDLLRELFAYVTLLLKEDDLLITYKHLFYYSFYFVYDQIGAKKVSGKTTKSYLDTLVENEVNRVKQMANEFREQSDILSECSVRLKEKIEGSKEGKEQTSAK